MVCSFGQDVVLVACTSSSRHRRLAVAEAGAEKVPDRSWSLAVPCCLRLGEVAVVAEVGYGTLSLPSPGFQPWLDEGKPINRTSAGRTGEGGMSGELFGSGVLHYPAYINSNVSLALP